MGLVLVVDDEQLIVETLVEVLVWEGHEVLTASNGVDALARIEERCPALLLIDFMMPLKDGVATLRELRGRADLVRIPTILMTAAPQGVPTTEQLYEVLLVKPFTVKTLREAMAKAFASSPD